MQSISTVTQKGQITLPIEMRKRFSIEKYGKVRLEAVRDHIKIYPVEDILDLAGFLKPKNKKPVLKAREAMEKSYERV